MRDCINSKCGGWGSQYRLHCKGESTRKCSSYASHRVKVRFLPLKGGSKPYYYFTSFKPLYGETLLRSGKEVVVRGFDKSSEKARWFAERPPSRLSIGVTNQTADAIRYSNMQLDKLVHPPIIRPNGGMTMDEFTKSLSEARAGALGTKVETLKEVSISAVKRTKNTVVRVKVGRIAIAAIKSALKKTPGLPVYAKLMLESDYADIVIGAVVPIVVPMVTKSEKIIRISEDINIAGGVAIADKLTFIDNFVAQVMEQISSAVTPEDLVDSKEEV